MPVMKTVILVGIHQLNSVGTYTKAPIFLLRTFSTTKEQISSVHVLNSQATLYL